MNNTYENFLDIINEALKKETFVFEPKELFEPITYTMMFGGKRIRPLMTLMACDMFGGKSEDAIYPAIGLEVFHNFTLIHDDILDNASIRRGQPTVFKKWNLNIAILSGDAMFALSAKYFLQTQSQFVIPVLEVFNKTALDVCRGQQYDMNFETSSKVSIDDYIEMIRLKTAVLLGACVKIGAITGNASQADASLAGDFAENLGVAFQLKDDILDLYSNQVVFGKKTGGDIIANKKTYLYLKALELADSEQKENLIKLFASHPTDETAKINEVKQIYDTLNIKAVTENTIRKYYEAAMENLSLIETDDVKKALFVQFSIDLMNREK